MADRDAAVIFDEQRALDFTGNDRDLLVEVAQMILAEGPGRLAEIRQAQANGDRAAIERLAHKLRGSLGSLAAIQASAAAEDLETAAADGDQPGIPNAIDALESAFRALRPAVERFIAGAPTEP